MEDYDGSDIAQFFFVLTFTVFQTGDDELREGGGGKRQIDVGCGIEVESTALANVLDAKSEHKRRTKDGF